MDTKTLINGNPQFAPYILYREKHWILYLNSRDQRFLCRSYVWLIGRHEDNMPFDRLTEEEHGELLFIMFLYRKTMELMWNPARINCAWLGNEVNSHRGHGHMHLVPRYEHAPAFGEREFPDPNPFGNFGGHDRLELSQDELLQLRDDIRKTLAMA